MSIEVPGGASGAAVRASRSRVQGLDVLRGVAIGLVLLRHAWPTLFGGAGIVGVVIFFVLSGFLITNLLSGDLHRYGGVRYWRFYRNRIFRLVPPLILMLVGVAAVSLSADLLDDRKSLVRAIFVAITYTGNFPWSVGSPAIAHLWTLATEEQFYLFWPLILTFAIRRNAPRWLFVISLAALAIAIAVSLFVFRDDVNRMYGLFTSWAIGLVLGGALAIFPKLIKVARRLPFVILSAAVLAFACFLPDLRSQWWAYVIVGPAIACAAAILVSRFGDVAIVPRTTAPLRWLGRISYAAYLWNYPIVLWLEALGINPQVVGPLSIALTLAAAQLSWLLVEHPIATVRRRFDTRRSRTPLPGSPDVAHGSPDVAPSP